MIFKKPARWVNKVFVHCSASDSLRDDNVATIRKWHLARGFTDIGYHYYIDKKGIVNLGRSLEKVPAAQEGHNTGSIAICCGGLKDFTPPQMKSLKALCEQINKVYGGLVTFHGHREVNANKSCPVYAYKEILNLTTDGHIKL